MSLTPFYRMVTGKTFEGAVVSHMRKSLLQFSGMLSNSYSSLGMNEEARWQFYKNTHLPCSMPS